jgi:hypothetical protein
MIPHIPRLKKPIEIGTLGFYEFSRSLSCLGKGLAFVKLFSGNEQVDQRVNKQQIIGNIFHDLIDKARELNDKKKLIDFASNLIKEQEEKHSQFLKDNKLGSIKSWSDVTRGIQISFNYLRNGESIIDSVEKKLNKLVTRDNRFKGVPDYYFISNETATIVEYKSTSILRDNKPRDEYIDQLKFYCVLIHDVFPQCENFSCILESLNGGRFKVNYSSREIEEHALFLDKKYKDFSKNVQNTKMFSFSEESCEYCDKKSLCDQYLDKCADIKSNKDIYVLESKYISESTVGKRKLLKFEDGEISTPANSSFINNLESDVFYRCYNLYLKNGQFLWGVNSGLYRV